MKNKKNVIRLTESQLHNVILESVKQYIRESRDDYDEYDEYDELDMDSTGAIENFYYFNFEDKLKKEFPDKEFECNFENYEEVEALDLESGAVYKASVPREIVYFGLGRPSSTDPYSEAEGEALDFDFDTAFRTIVSKIQNNQPDEFAEGFDK